MTATASKGHRQDIQQLRGIAVLAVIINHLGATWLPGGYLGVDMFFVVSGFVITLSMISGGSMTSSRGRFFAQFWIRRMFRLWPMLFVTVLATTVFLLVSGLATPGPLLTGLSAVLAVSNFRLLVGRLEYFALDTGADWFMHTWSLAVEEQIYVVFSIVFAVIGIRRGAPDVPLRIRRLILIVGGLVVVSVFFAFVPNTSEVVRFYAPHTRFYQVGAGALVALLLARRGISSIALQSATRTGLLVLGGGGLLALFVLNPWSGRTLSLVTTLLTVLVIAVASAQQQTIGFVRGRWLSGIGDRSYALYLVHWPVQLLAVTAIASVNLRYAFSLGLTFLLGYVAYRLVENSTRHRWKMMHPIQAIAVAAVALLAVFSTTAFSYYRTDQEAKPASVAIPSENCAKEDATVWVIGDSHLNALSPEIAQAVDGDCAIIGTYGIVLDFIDLERSATGQRSLRMKLIPTAWLIEQIRAAAVPPRALVVVHFLSAFLSDPSTAPASADFVATEWQSTTGERVTRDEFINLFTDNLRQLSQVMALHGGALIVTSPPPDFDWLSVDIDPSLCKSRVFVSRECALLRSEVRVSLTAHEARGDEVRRLLDGLQRDLPNFVHIALDIPFCSSEYCSNFRDGIPMYLDDDHLNFAGAQLVGGYFDAIALRLRSTGSRDLRCVNGQSVYECRLVERGGILGEYLLIPRFVDTASTTVRRSHVTHTDDNGTVHCISFWASEEVTFVGGSCEGGS